MWKKIGIGIAALLALFLGYCALQSPEYVISRSVVIKAPAEKIFPYLNSSKLSHEWMNWSEIDPTAKMVYEGPEAGVGARTSWTGGKQLGTGSATVTESVANQHVGIRLEYSEPMKMEQFAEYIVEPKGSETQVSWKVTGKNNFIGRVMCSFVDMDKMVGGMFEQGLARLKTVVEAN